MKNGWLQDTSNVAKKAAEVAQKKGNNWPMVSFIHNRREIIIWMGHSFKTKAQNPKQHFKRTTTFFNFKLQITRLAQGHWCFTPTY